MKILPSRIIQLTVPCSDNGERFTRTDRLDLIQKTVANLEYDVLGDWPLAKVYRHRAFQPDRSAILISSHIDSLYDDYYATTKDGELQGTFDNSACNAITVEGMINNLFPSQVLISFTGDEEGNSKGVDQTIESLQEKNIFANLEMVISLDLTEEHYRFCHFTIENYFIEQDNTRSLLRFGSSRDLKTYLREMIISPKFVKDAEADESWQYNEYDLNCFSLCLPCRLLGTDMHANAGVAILCESLIGYWNALGQLSQAINNDLANKLLQRTANHHR